MDKVNICQELTNSEPSGRERGRERGREGRGVEWRKEKEGGVKEERKGEGHGKGRRGGGEK